MPYVIANVPIWQQCKRMLTVISKYVTVSYHFTDNKCDYNKSL